MPQPGRRVNSGRILTRLFRDHRTDFQPEPTVAELDDGAATGESQLAGINIKPQASRAAEIGWAMDHERDDLRSAAHHRRR
jgi:hypothetical protein